MLLNVTCTRYECEVVLIVVVVVEIGESMKVWLLNEKLKPRCAISASKFTIVSGSTRETEIVLATTSKLTKMSLVLVLFGSMQALWLVVHAQYDASRCRQSVLCDVHKTKDQKPATMHQEMTK